jgi:hypothetical protein
VSAYCEGSTRGPDGLEYFCDEVKGHVGMHHDTIADMRWADWAIEVRADPHLEMDGDKLVQHLMWDHWADGATWPSGHVGNFKSAHARMDHY